MTVESCDRQREREVVGRDRDDVGDLDRVLRRAAARGRGARRGTRRRAMPKWRRKRSVDCFATSGAARSQCWPHSISSALRGSTGSSNARVVAQPLAGRMAGVDHDVLGQADRVREFQSLAAAVRPAPAAGTDRSSSAGRAGSRCRRRRGRSSRARARSRVWRGAVEHVGRPQPVEVLVHAARRERIGGVERAERVDVGEHERQRAAHRPHVLAQQPVVGDRAADLVAVRQRLDRHVRARALGGEPPHVGNAGVAARPSDRGRGTRRRSAARSSARLVGHRARRGRPAAA